MVVPLLPAPVKAGLRENALLFALLVLVNAFVGTMVGIERTLVPLLGEEVFGLASKSAVLSFIATFGLVKAFSNLAAGAWSERVGRRRVLLVGWAIGLPVPLLLMFAPAPHWWIVILANVLLGVNQGLCWSMAVVMKVDVAGEKRRGLAMGLNEFAGYGAVGLAAFATGFLASEFGIRPVPFALGAAAALAGLAVSYFLVPDTGGLVRHHGPPPVPGREAFVRLTAGDRRILALNQAGLANNLNDGVAWGLFPILFAAAVADTAAVGALVALYPLTWGVAQLGTGALSDRIGRFGLIAAGMLVQAVAIAALLWPGSAHWAAAMIALGLGTAMVYPTLLSAVADVAGPRERATALGVYRFWRDMGFAVGALGAGLAADLFGMPVAIGLVALVTGASGLVVAVAYGSAAWPAANAARALR
ncbi:MAG TPA: MFS transporter [Candidatus Thermoplasmatota archaeon]|nr:MFS transporter [Candidatus Thermoplasmatota archaeon]